MFKRIFMTGRKYFVMFKRYKTQPGVASVARDVSDVSDVSCLNAPAETYLKPVETYLKKYILIPLDTTRLVVLIIQSLP